LLRASSWGLTIMSPKPFSHIELIARVQAVLRRSQGMPIVGGEEHPFVAGKIAVDFASNEVRVEGNPVKLTSTEYKLLQHLVRNEGRLLTHENLLNKVWERNIETPATSSGSTFNTSDRSSAIPWIHRVSSSPSTAGLQVCPADRCLKASGFFTP